MDADTAVRDMTTDYVEELDLSWPADEPVAMALARIAYAQGYEDALTGDRQ